MKILNYTRPSDVISQNNLALACLNGVLDALPHYAETEEYYVNVAAALTLYTAAPIPLEIQGSVIDRLPAPLTMRLIKVGMGLSGRRKMRQLVMMTHNLSYLRDMYPTISKYSAGYVGGVVNDVRGMLSGYLAADPTGIVVQYLWTNCF
jgi:hypothetical protein